MTAEKDHIGPGKFNLAGPGGQHDAGVGGEDVDAVQGQVHLVFAVQMEPGQDDAVGVLEGFVPLEIQRQRGDPRPGRTGHLTQGRTNVVCARSAQGRHAREQGRSQSDK